MGSLSSKRYQQARDSVQSAETDRLVTSEFSIDCAKTNAENEKERFPSTLKVDKSSPMSFGEKKEEQKTREQEQSAMCPDDVTLRLASALRAALIQGDGSSFPACLPGSHVEFTVHVTRTLIPAAEPLKKDDKVDLLKNEGKADLKNEGKVDLKNEGKVDLKKKDGNVDLKNEGKVDLPKKDGNVDLKNEGKVDLPNKDGKVDLQKKDGKVDRLKKESKVDQLKKEDKLKSHQMKPSHAGSDRRQQCGGAVNVPRHCHQSPVSNGPPMSSSDAGACSARRPKPVGGDMLPAGLLPHVRQVTGCSPPPTYANACAADVYRHYRRVRRQREQSASVAAAWILGNNFGGNVGSVDRPVGMLYYGHPPMVRTSGDGAESRN